MPEYEYLRLLERKNKDNKPYTLALVLFNRENDSDLLRILVKDEQVDDLCGLEAYTDISDMIKIEYNSYQKKYEPRIVF